MIVSQAASCPARPRHPAQQVSGVAAGNRAVGLGQMEGVRERASVSSRTVLKKTPPLLYKEAAVRRRALHGGVGSIRTAPGGGGRRGQVVVRLLLAARHGAHALPHLENAVVLRGAAQHHVLREGPAGGRSAGAAVEPGRWDSSSWIRNCLLMAISRSWSSTKAGKYCSSLSLRTISRASP